MLASPSLPPAPRYHPPMSAHDTRQALDISLRELDDWLHRAGAGEVVVVPDGLIGTVQRLRSDLTSSLGPRDAGDLAWILSEILRRQARLESMTLTGRWRALLAWCSARWAVLLRRVGAVLRWSPTNQRSE